VLTDRCRDLADIEVVRLAEGLSDSVQLVNRVAAFHRELPAGSSSGVRTVSRLLAKTAALNHKR
jgi:hypothetical protein